MFYLFSLGVGLGSVVGDVDGVSYSAFVAPAMLASSAMNGAVTDATFNVFFKLRYNKIYDSVLSTPVAPVDIALGEIIWALVRGLIYSAGFLAVMLAMGLVSSWWAVLVLPASVLIGFAFAGAGMAATTYMRSWQDFEWIVLTTLPMFLLSATFYPLSTYPPALQLRRAVDAALPGRRPRPLADDRRRARVAPAQRRLPRGHGLRRAGRRQPPAGHAAAP